MPVVIHADDWLIVVDKPAGLRSVPGRGPEQADCMHARLLRDWPDALAVHRLDMATSGLLVFARGLEALRRLSRAFERREVGKRYAAIVAGRARPAEPDAEGWGRIDLPLAADALARPRQRIDHEAGRPSLTLWRPEGEAHGPWGDGTRVALRPVTGRSHQLRVHLASLGHPIVGDPLYASEALERASPRLLLHAAQLALMHPGDGRPVVWRSPAPF